MSHPLDRPPARTSRSSTDRRAPVLTGRAPWQAPIALPANPKGTAVPSQDRGLLARLDALVELAADRHGLALLPGGRLAAGARAAARVTGLAPARGSTARASAVTQRDAVELLRAVAEGVGLLRVRGDRLEATSLRNAWSQIEESLRAGLTYAAWCQQVTLTGLPVWPGRWRDSVDGERSSDGLEAEQEPGDRRAADAEVVQQQRRGQRREGDQAVLGGRPDGQARTK